MNHGGLKRQTFTTNIDFRSSFFTGVKLNLNVYATNELAPSQPQTSRHSPDMSQTWRLMSTPLMTMAVCTDFTPVLVLSDITRHWYNGKKREKTSALWNIAEECRMSERHEGHFERQQLWIQTHFGELPVFLCCQQVTPGNCSDPTAVVFDTTSFSWNHFHQHCIETAATSKCKVCWVDSLSDFSRS